jgi:23S rRNA (guanosine2251-2'-O)-methyltransferase
VDLLYGRNSVAEALRGRRRVHRVVTAHGAHGLEALTVLATVQRVRVEVADRDRLDRLTQGAHHQGVVAEAEPFPYSHLDDLVSAETPFLLVLDSLQDPQNFGSLLRTAQVCGIDGVVIPEHRSVSVTPAVSNASAGAIEHLRVARVTNLARTLEALKSHNVWSYGLAVDARTAYFDTDLRGGIALVIGSEGAGLSRLVREKCDALVSIPMAAAAVQSLNASVAGSLVVYEAFRQRSATADSATVDSA